MSGDADPRAVLGLGGDYVMPHGTFQTITSGVMNLNASAAPLPRFDGQLLRALDHFNQALIEGRLPPCLITLRSSNRQWTRS